MKNKISTIILCICTVLFTITFSIALPICVRPFYYAHIEKYNLVEITGKSETQIKEAYAQVLDYLTLPNKEFSTGDFAFSEEGKSHFVDCKGLFTLNFAVLFISLTVIILLYILTLFKPK
jgi:integral membrane protein (TIGR01906 family)